MRPHFLYVRTAAAVCCQRKLNTLKNKQKAFEKFSSYFKRSRTIPLVNLHKIACKLMQYGLLIYTRWLVDYCDIPYKIERN